jgi:hypothetical protein
MLLMRFTAPRSLRLSLQHAARPFAFHSPPHCLRHTERPRDSPGAHEESDRQGNPIDTARLGSG